MKPPRSALPSWACAGRRAAGGPASYWSLDAAELRRRLDVAGDGLSSEEAERRLETLPADAALEPRGASRLAVLRRQLASPLLLLLVFAAGASFATGEWRDASIVLAIIVASVGIGYSREYRAERALATLRARIAVSSVVVRDGREVRVPRQQIVPGDVIRLSAGTLVPADAVVLDAVDCFVSEGVLTGESFPVEKTPGPVAAGAPLAGRTNCVFLGTNVRSGTARAVVVDTGAATELGAIAGGLARRRPDTDFDRGLRRFGYVLMSAMVVIVFVVFVANLLRGLPVIDTLLFSIALAVGLSPELLPAILSVNLARGAQMMARRGVLVRRLNAIENLGSMTVLCTDKTGTLTEGLVKLDGAFDAAAAPAPSVLTLAATNAALETGLANPLDDAILAAETPDLTGVEKLAEIPFDFVRRRVSVVVRRPGGGVLLITKGAFHAVLPACTTLGDGAPLDDAHRAAVETVYERWSSQGVRLLAVATRALDQRDAYRREDEVDLTLAGMVTFLDRPKEGAGGAVRDLCRLGVAVKMITGDNRLVAAHVAALVGLDQSAVVTGAQIDQTDDAALPRAVDAAGVFAEIDPTQKERIILALKRAGHVVGFLGDGVNDAPAMHAADTSLSVDDAVDVAREAADFVLLERDLDVIRGGVEEGRRTFANTMKYILTTTSANLGNMLSMAAASFVLPFLPLLAGQILLNNLLSDVPAIGLADDTVDPELVERPPRWDQRFIARFMLQFGVLSSAFDAVTFALLLVGLHAGVALFRTGWFVESLLTELAVALVVRTRRPFFRSRPGRVLLDSTVALMAVALVIAYLPFAGLFGFVPLPPVVLGAVIAITLAYVAATELLKWRFYRTQGGGVRS